MRGISLPATSSNKDERCEPTVPGSEGIGQGNPLQFAVVREDPLIEMELLKHAKAGKALSVASGGCVALSLKANFPDLKLTLFDFNKAQLEHVQKKIEKLKGPRDESFKRFFNIGTPDLSGLNECGNFESLFRGFRGFIHDLVAPYGDFTRFFEDPHEDTGFLGRVFGNRYWPVGFQMFFSDPLLNTMFGLVATQRAPKGSYPRYFQQVLEKGLRSPNVSENYFLHHIFLGHYMNRPQSLPLYLRNSAPQSDLQLIEGTIEGVSGLGEYDLVSLSNIMDWMSDLEVHALARLVCSRAKKDSVVVFRQLNNFSDFQAQFRPEFSFDEGKAGELLEQDGSLFYCKLNIGYRK